MVSEVFMICDAYESGVGKGLEGREEFRKAPYKEGTPEAEAYETGYEFGELKRKRRIEMQGTSKPLVGYTDLVDSILNLREELSKSTSVPYREVVFKLNSCLFSKYPYNEEKKDGS